MTMLEKAARAIHAEHPNLPMAHANEWPHLDAAYQETCLKIVRAVLAAIREPDEAMKKAITDCLAYWSEEHTRDDQCEVYTAMIDAILAEKP